MATQLPSLAALPLTLSVHMQDDKERLQQEKQAPQDQHGPAADTLQEHQELLHEARWQSLDLEGRVAAFSGHRENEPDFDAAELRAATAEPRRASEDAGLWSRLEAGWPLDATCGFHCAPRSPGETRHLDPKVHG